MENQNDPKQKKDYQSEMATRKDDAGYNPQEQQFADGKGTQLNEELAPDRGDIEDELSQQVEGTFEDQKFGDQELDQDLEEFKNNDDQ